MKMTITNVQNQTNAFYPSHSSSVIKTENSNDNTAPVNQEYRVELSKEAQDLSRQEQYKLKDASDLFHDWQEMNIDYPVLIYPSNIPENNDRLLPENKPIIEQLNAKRAHTNDLHERTLIEIKIDLVRGLGDKEIFKNLSDVDNREKAVSESFYLQQKYSVEKHGRGMLSYEEGVERGFIKPGSDSRLQIFIPSLDSPDEMHFQNNPAPEVSALFESKGYSLDQFQDKDFLFELLIERKTVMDSATEKANHMNSAPQQKAF